MNFTKLTLKQLKDKCIEKHSLCDANACPYLLFCDVNGFGKYDNCPADWWLPTDIEENKNENK